MLIHSSLSYGPTMGSISAFFFNLFALTIFLNQVYSEVLMFILGIETTAHTFGVGIVNSAGSVLANITASYTSPDAGMIPDKVAEHHQQVAAKVMQEAF